MNRGTALASSLLAIVLPALLAVSGCVSGPIGHAPEPTDLDGLGPRETTVAIMPPTVIVDGLAENARHEATKQVADDMAATLTRAFTSRGYKVVAGTASSTDFPESTEADPLRQAMVARTQIRIIPIGERFMTEVAIMVYRRDGRFLREINWVIEPPPPAPLTSNDSTNRTTAPK